MAFSENGKPQANPQDSSNHSDVTSKRSSKGLSDADKAQTAWDNRSNKWLINDQLDRKKYYGGPWNEQSKMKIQHLEKELRNTMNMFTCAATDAQDTSNFWGNMQLMFGFLGTTIAFVNASDLPETLATAFDCEPVEVMTALSVAIGVVSITSTAVAERLKKKDYAVKASNFERIRVDYQGVHERIKSEMAFPKMAAIDFEAKVRRIMQDLVIGHIQHQPPPEIKEMFGFVDSKARDKLGVLSTALRWIKYYCCWCCCKSDDDAISDALRYRPASSRASLAVNRNKDLEKELKAKGSKLSPKEFKRRAKVLEDEWKKEDETEKQMNLKAVEAKEKEMKALKEKAEEDKVEHDRINQKIMNLKKLAMLKQEDSNNKELRELKEAINQLLIEKEINETPDTQPISKVDDSTPSSTEADLVDLGPIVKVIEVDPEYEAKYQAQDSVQAQQDDDDSVVQEIILTKGDQDPDAKALKSMD